MLSAKKHFKYRCLLSLWLIALSANVIGQSQKIDILYGGNFKKDEAQFPGASIFTKDVNGQVQFRHQGADMWCDQAFLYADENRIYAEGNIYLEQGDTLKLWSNSISYNGNSRLLKAMGKVRMLKDTTSLQSDTLYFNREDQMAYYNTGGKIIDSNNILTSRFGTYFIDEKKYQFDQKVHIDNPEYTLDSDKLTYYTDTKYAYLNGPSTIVGEDYQFYCEKGFYNTELQKGYGNKNTEIHYSDRIINGDSVYFENATSFASATNNIQVLDTINQSIIRSNYAEVWKAIDSVFATKRAVAINVLQNDSLYIHGDTLFVTGTKENRVLKSYRNSRFFKTGMSGICDTIKYIQTEDVTELIGDPVVWNGESQLTGDKMWILSDPETQKLDSLIVESNAFVVSKDTINNLGFNQAKGADLGGKFVDNALNQIKLHKNTELIYYMYDENQELLGVNKTICSEIELQLENGDIRDIIFRVNPDGTIYPIEQFPEEMKKLEGFIWREDERIYTLDDLIIDSKN